MNSAFFQEEISTSSPRLHPIYNLLQNPEKLDKFVQAQNDYGSIMQSRPSPLQEKMPYVKHKCGQNCMVKYVPCLTEDENPYVIPVLLGWARDVMPNISKYTG